MQKIVPHLWFDGAAEPAVRRYADLVPGSRVGRVTRYGAAGTDIHGQPEGKVMTVEVTLGDTTLVAMNGGPQFRPTPAVSYFVTLAEADAVDRFWEGLIDGGRSLMPLDAYDWAPRYGWLEDRWGVSWQVALGDPSDVGRTVAPSLMFTGEQVGRAEEAMAHYAAVFPDAAIQGVHRYDGSGVDAEGTVMHAQFTLCGETFMAMDSALDHGFGFSTANSHLVLCRDQAEIDHYWRALSAVPEAEQCGWLADRYGVSWQVAPARMIEMMTDPDPARVARVTDAFMAMKKLDLAALERAYAA